LFVKTEFILNMIWKYNIRLIGGFVFISLSSSNFGMAQNSSLEFWPETDIWYRLNSSWRLSSFIPITKYNESESRDMNVYLNTDYAWGHSKFPISRRMLDQEKEQIMKAWMIRGGFMKGWSLRNNSSNYSESMVFSEVHKRIPLNGNILLSHRFRTDTRWLGKDSDFSYRFRYRLMVEKEYIMGKNSMVPYVNIEPYWDSRYSKVIKTRILGGATLSKGPRYSFEGNLTYQYDETYDTENLYALNVILHIFLE